MLRHACTVTHAPRVSYLARRPQMRPQEWPKLIGDSLVQTAVSNHPSLHGKLMMPRVNDASLLAHKDQLVVNIVNLTRPKDAFLSNHGRSSKGTSSRGLQVCPRRAATRCKGFCLQLFISASSRSLLSCSLSCPALSL